MGYGALMVPSFFLSAVVGSASAFGLAGGGGSGGSLPVLSADRAWIRRSGTGAFGLPSPTHQARRPGLSSIIPISDNAATWVGRHHRRIARGHVLFSTSDDDDDDDDDDAATDEVSGPRRVGRPKVSDEELEERKEQLRELLCATKAEIDQLVRNNPTILERRDLLKNYGPKVAMLQEKLGINQKAVGKLCLAGNRVLPISLETLGGKIDWLQARLILNKAQLRKIIKRSPVILALSIKDNIEPALDNIQSVLELSDKDLTKMVVKAPELLQKNFSTEKLAARLSFLQSLLSIEENDFATLRKAIVKRPEMLFYPEERMVESQHWISGRLGLSDEKIAQMCRNTPYLLMSKVTTLEDKVDRLQAAMSLSDEEVGHLFGKYPSLFGYDPERKIEPKLRYLRQRLDLDDQGLKDLVTKQPGLFSRTEEDIEEKIKIYSGLVGESEAKRIVTKSTNLLIISLEKRLKPRLSGIQKAGTKVIWTEKLIQRLARRSDDLWERHGLEEAPRGRRRSSD